MFHPFLSEPLLHFGGGEIGPPIRPEPQGFAPGVHPFLQECLGGCGIGCMSILVDRPPVGETIHDYEELSSCIIEYIGRDLCKRDGDDWCGHLGFSWE